MDQACRQGQDVPQPVPNFPKAPWQCKGIPEKPGQFLQPLPQAAHLRKDRFT